MARIKLRTFAAIARAIDDFMSKCENITDNYLDCDPTDGAIDLKHANSGGDAVYASSTLYASPFSDLQNQMEDIGELYTAHIYNLENGIGAYGAYIPSAPSIVQPMLVLQLDGAGTKYGGIQ
jgi:hypothetical protein